jgi:hypothetical protein
MATTPLKLVPEASAGEPQVAIRVRVREVRSARGGWLPENKGEARAGGELRVGVRAHMLGHGTG